MAYESGAYTDPAVRQPRESQLRKKSSTGGSFLRRWFKPCCSKSETKSYTDLQSISNYGVDINHNSNEIAAKHGATQVKTQVERVGKEKRDDAQINRENASVKHKSVENPLKKYAPVSVPGWEVNIIYKPSRKTNYSMPSHTNVSSKVASEVAANTFGAVESSDVAGLIDGMDGGKDVRGGASETKEARSVFWKPVTAVQKLMKRVRGTGRN